MILLFNFFRGSKTIIMAWILLTIWFFGIVFITKIALSLNKPLWIPLYLGYLSINLMIGSSFAQHSDLGFASVVIIMCETVRMMMKAHSYFRTKMLYLT